MVVFAVEDRSFLRTVLVVDIVVPEKKMALQMRF